MFPWGKGGGKTGGSGTGGVGPPTGVWRDTGFVTPGDGICANVFEGSDMVTPDALTIGPCKLVGFVPAGNPTWGSKTGGTPVGKTGSELD